MLHHIALQFIDFCWSLYHPEVSSFDIVKTFLNKIMHLEKPSAVNKLLAVLTVLFNNVNEMFT